MQVSTKLFNDQQIRQFGKLTADIQQKQEKISSGKAILRASDDPVAAANLSAAKEQEQLLTRFEENSYKAQLRLDASDKTINEAMSVITRITELATQARSPVFDGFSRKAILTEVQRVKHWLIWQIQTQMGKVYFLGIRLTKLILGLPMAVSTITATEAFIPSKFPKCQCVYQASMERLSFVRVDTSNGRRIYSKLLM